TNLTSTDLALPEGNSAVPVYVRVRAADHAENEDKPEDDIVGNWTNTASASVTPIPSNSNVAAPTLSSPLDNYTSRGFTLILEWMGATPSTARVQVARDENFSDTLFDNLARDNQFICPSPALHMNDVLYWRVKTTGASAGAFSAPKRFTVGQPHHEHEDTFVN